MCPTPLSPAGHDQRGQSCRTHTHSSLLQLCSQCTNHGSQRQPSFSCQKWKQNRWEMKCWDWPDLVDDCSLNSGDWNWAFYTLAAAQDTICPSIEDNMAWVACHVKYQFPRNSKNPTSYRTMRGKNTVFIRTLRWIRSDSSEWLITLSYTVMVQCLYWVHNIQYFL